VCVRATQQVPTDIPSGVYFINLSMNAITSLRQGDLDAYTSLLDIDLSNNAIAVVGVNTWTAQMTRSNDPSTFLPLSVLNMAGT
jgi:hypothetical protein